MSSLGVSLLLLVVVAIAIAVGYNLRQGAWPRWGQALRRMRARGQAGSTDTPRRHEASAGNGRRSSERGEPRLGAGTPEKAPTNLADLDDGWTGSAPARGATARGATAEDAMQQPGPAAGERVFEAREPDGEAREAGRFSAAGGGSDRRTAPAAAASSAPLAQPAASAGSPVARAASGAAAASASAVAPASASPGAREAGDRPPEPAAPAAVPAAAGAPASPAAAATVVAPASAATVAASAATAGPVLSEACDCVVELAPASPLVGERLLAIAQRFRRAGSKPVAFDARERIDDEGFGVPMAGRSYEIVRVGILLANRHGPLNAMEFSEFVSAAQSLAESLSAHAEMPAMGSVLARARDLDSTCAQLDVQIGVNVETPEAVEPAQLAALAAALSLVERGSHRYVRPGPQGEPLFSLGFSDSPNKLTFLLDVPRVPASLEPYARMVQAASACAQRLGARLVDDSGKPLTQASLAQIARQLQQRYESLEAIGLPAGSTLACKVFN